MTTLARLKLINRLARNQKFSYFAVGLSVISLMINIPMLEFAWKAYNKLSFNRNVELSLPDRKCRRLKNNAENITQNQNFIYFAVAFSVISLTRN